MVNKDLAQQARRFIDTFNKLFGEKLPPLISNRLSAIGTHSMITRSSALEFGLGTTTLLRLSAIITGRSGAPPTESSQYRSFGAPKFGQQHDTARLFTKRNDILNFEGLLRFSSLR